MAFYRTRVNTPGVLCIDGVDYTTDPKVTYDSDDDQDNVLLKARPDLFREIKSSPAPKRGRTAA